MALRKSRSRPVLQSDEESSSTDKRCSSKQEKGDGKENRQSDARQRKPFPKRSEMIW